jgi:hypothetical protein
MWEATTLDPRMHPHPYFGDKILVFMSLEAVVRCKIFKTKEFHAKYSRIRSYVEFRPLLVASGWKAARRLLRILCDEGRK